MYQKIGFIGLGLIGGSIARSIHNQYPKINIIAHSGHLSTITEAYEAGVIDNSDFLPISEFGQCDLVFLCSPVGVNISYLKELKSCLSEDCLITDVGSVKGDIAKEVTILGLDSHFIGGHPMAGTEQIGFSHSSAGLLENAYYILCPNEKVSGEKVTEFSDFIRSLGPVPITMTTEEHDFATAGISHLPHVVSASLVRMVLQNDKTGNMKEIAAGGFRDITRISSSSPKMWQHICLSNRDEILHLMDLFETSYSEFKSAVEKSDSEEILRLFSASKDYRDSLPVKNSSVYELYVDLSDEPGAIATIAVLMSVNGISIKNIGILHNREFEQGVLSIEFYEPNPMENAKEILEKKDYKVYTR